MSIQSVEHNKVALLGAVHEHKTSHHKALGSACQSMGWPQLICLGNAILTCAVVMARTWLLGRRQINQTSLKTLMNTCGLMDPKRWLLILSLLLPSFYQAHAAATLIKEVPTVRGLMRLVENEQLNSFLVFPQEQRQLILNSAWRSTNIEYLTQVGDQTVVVMAYADALCTSRQALIAVTPRGVWGPYQVGGCEDTLIYQRSEAKDSFVALNPRDAMAWVYTASDEKFRGPARIELPEQLRQFVSTAPSLPTPTPITTPPTETPKVVAPPVTTQAPRAQRTSRQSAGAAASIPLALPPTAPSVVTTTTTAAASAPQRQNPVQNRSPKFSSADASVVAEKVAKTTRPQRQVVIDLM